MNIDLTTDRSVLVRAEPLVIVEGRLQKLKNNINILATRVGPLEDTKLRHTILGVETDEPAAEEVDPQLAQFAQLAPPLVRRGPRVRCCYLSVGWPCAAIP